MQKTLTYEEWAKLPLKLAITIPRPPMPNDYPETKLRGKREKPEPLPTEPDSPPDPKIEENKINKLAFQFDLSPDQIKAIVSKKPINLSYLAKKTKLPILKIIKVVNAYNAL